MLIVVAIVLLLVLIFGPQIWSKHVFKKYATEIAELPGSGGQLAQHLITHLKLGEIRVESGGQDDNYYDPDKKLISLSEDNFNNKSLTAITVAAHEIGHAIQDKANYRPLLMRSRLVKVAYYAEKIAATLLVAFPFMSLLTRVPTVGIVMLITGLTIMLLPVLVHLITLPVELDASFKKALPLLIHGEYIPDSAVPIVRRILVAAALTYVAASLASLLNFYRWMLILRR